MRVLVSYFLTPKSAHQIIPYFALILSLLSDVSGKYYDFSSQGASSFLLTGTGDSTGLGKSSVYLARSSDPATRRFPRVLESETTPSGSHLAEVRAQLSILGKTLLYQPPFNSSRRAGVEFELRLEGRLGGGLEAALSSASE